MGAGLRAVGQTAGGAEAGQREGASAAAACELLAVCFAREGVF